MYVIIRLQYQLLPSAYSVIVSDLYKRNLEIVINKYADDKHSVGWLFYVEHHQRGDSAP